MTLSPPAQSAIEEMATPFAPDPASTMPPMREAIPAGPRQAPFLDEYFVGDQVVAQHPERVAFMELMDELYDDEFDHLLAELAEEAYTAYESATPLGETNGPAGGDPEGFMRAYLAPLQTEAERIIDRADQALAGRDLASLSEGELDGLLETVDAPEASMSPLFEQFLGGLVKKIKKTAQSAWSAAKSVASKLMPINLILGHVKKLVKPMLERVLKYALNRLPPTIRPIAASLAKRLLGEISMAQTEAASALAGVPATADVGLIQEAFDTGIVSALMAGDSIEGEVAMAEAESGLDPDSNAVAELEHARAAFIREINDLPDGGDPSPAVERFLPAVLPFVRMGISVIGRPRVVNFIAGQLGLLIGKYIGRDQSVVLSRAIADAGLRMLTLEAPEEDAAETAGAAMAAAIEDTVRELGQLDESEFADEALLGASTLAAFTKAAGVNFPSSLLRPAARRTLMNGVWAFGPRRRAGAGYKKYSRRLGTRISPWLASRLPAADGATLHEFLQEQYEADGDVEATAHLYEAIPGTRLAHVAAAEADAIGQGASDLEFHPLTREAASTLFAEPGLAADGAGEAAEDPLTPEVGDRFYFLEVKAPRRTALAVAGHGRVRRRPTQVRLALNPGTSGLTVRMYLSERRAQEFAARINRGGGAPITGELAALATGLIDRVLGGGTPRRLRLGPGGFFGPSRHRALRQRLMQMASVIKPMQLGGKISGWLSGAMSGSPTFAADFAKAAGDQRTGVTIVAVMNGVQGLSALADLLSGKAMPAGQPVPALGPPQGSTIRVLAGFDT
jgi:hypothetical protein